MLEEPAIIKQGNKFGVKIHSEAPSIHLIRANIETEIAPIVGSEQQAEDLIRYIKDAKESEGGIWSTNIFGKSIEELVMDGMQNKMAMINDESQAETSGFYAEDRKRHEGRACGVSLYEMRAAILVRRGQKSLE